MRNNKLENIRSSSYVKAWKYKAARRRSLCLIQDINAFGNSKGLFSRCKSSTKTVDHLATKCNKIVVYDYIKKKLLNAYIYYYAINIS